MKNNIIYNVIKWCEQLTHSTGYFFQALRQKQGNRVNITASLRTSFI